MAPNRKRPFSRAHEKQILAILRSGALSDWAEELREIIECAVCFSRCTAARKAELCGDDNPHFFSRANITWYINGVEVAPTPENI